MTKPLDCPVKPDNDIYSSGNDIAAYHEINIKNNVIIDYARIVAL